MLRLQACLAHWHSLHTCKLYTRHSFCTAMFKALLACDTETCLCDKALRSHVAVQHVLAATAIWAMQGWASFYDFNFSDLRSGADVVIANSKGRQPHWDKLRGLLENAIYGGRVNCALDIKVELPSACLLQSGWNTFAANSVSCWHSCKSRPMHAVKLICRQLIPLAADTDQECMHKQSNWLV